MFKPMRDSSAKMVCAGLMVAGLAGQAQAAPVTFSPPVAIGAGTTSLFNFPEHFIVSAVDLAPTTTNGVIDNRGPGAPFVNPTTTVTGNGITFTAVNEPGAGATTTIVEGRNNDSGTSTPGAGPAYTGDAGFDSILNSDIYDVTAPATVDVTLTGLTVGVRYSVQLFAVRVLGGVTNLVFTAPDAGSNSVSYNANGNNNYVIGTFFADAATQTINVNGTNGVAFLSALVVRQIVPEIDPSRGLVPLALLAMLGLAYRDRRRARAVIH